MGVDIGGTKIATTLGTADGEILIHSRFQTMPGWRSNVDRIMTDIDAAIEETMKKPGQSAPKAIGVSCGGPLDSRAGVIQSPPNLPGWDDVPICSMLHDRYQLPVMLENDANACALAEWKWGAGAGLQNVVFLTFGTGLGAGLILNGALYSGTTGLAGEVGHIRLSEDGPEGYGKRGSWEGYCSGGGLSRAYLDAFGARKTAEQICREATDGGLGARRVIEESAKYLGRGLALLVDTLNPEAVIIGSIYTQAIDLFLPGMQRSLEAESLPAARSVCRILPSKLGETLGDMAALGVAMTGAEHEPVH